MEQRPTENLGVFSSLDAVVSFFHWLARLEQRTPAVVKEVLLPHLRVVPKVAAIGKGSTLAFNATIFDGTGRHEIEITLVPTHFSLHWEWSLGQGMVQVSVTHFGLAPSEGYQEGYSLGFYTSPSLPENMAWLAKWIQEHTPASVEALRAQWGQLIDS